MNKLDVSNSFLSCSENDSPITQTVAGIECGALNRTAILTRYGRRYVIKGLRKEYQDSAVHRAQLRKEFDIVSSLDHRSIAKAFTIERIEGFGEAIVMEYVDGMTLGRWLSGDTTASQRLRVAQEIIEAMVYVHSTGISHRDLKPDNIMITHRDNSVKVIDFGLGDRDDFTILKQSRGTERYGAPEQKSEGSEADRRADVYSVAKIISGMDLRAGYRRALRRALSPDPADRPTMERLARSFASVGRRRRFAAVALPTIAAATLLFLLIPRNGNDADMITSTVSATESPARRDSIPNKPATLPVAAEETSVPVTGAQEPLTAHEDKAIDIIYDLAVAKADSINETFVRLIAERGIDPDPFDSEDYRTLLHERAAEFDRLEAEFKRKAADNGVSNREIHQAVALLNNYIFRLPI